MEAWLCSGRANRGTPSATRHRLAQRCSPALALHALQVQQAERTVREIATLNQMFSTAIMHQSEQIEKLYSQVSLIF